MRTFKFKGPSVRQVENAYAVLALVATSTGAWKLAVQPKVHTSQGLVPIWQFVAGIIAAGIIYTLYQLMEGGSK